MALRSEGFRTIGLYVRAIGTEFYGLLAAAISDEAEKAGYHVALATSSAQSGSASDAVDYLRSLRSEAIIVASGRIDIDRMVGVARHIPLVVAGCVSSPPGLTTVSDDGTGVDSLVDEVVAAGHRNVGVVDVSERDSMTQGYRSAKLLTSLAAVGCVVTRVPFDPDFEAPEGRVLREALADITVLMCASDPVMINAWEMLTSWGLDVPNDISLTGYDGIGALSSPVLGLTTWSQPLDEVGRTAARRAIQMTTSPLEPAHVRLRGQLVRGRTLGTPRPHPLPSIA